MNILHVDSSPLGEASASRRLTAAIVETLRRTTRGVEVSHRDLAAAPPVIASSRCGVYAEHAGMQALDHQESSLRTVLGFLGITDVTVIRAEGLALGDAPRSLALERAQAQIDLLPLRAAA